MSLRYLILTAIALMLIICFALFKQYNIPLLTISGNHEVKIFSTIAPITLSTSTVAPNATKKPESPRRVAKKTIWSIPTGDQGGRLNQRFEYKQSDWYKAAIEIYKDWEFKSIDIQCTNVQFVGNWPVCFDGVFEVKSPCLVYSFGIAFDFSFDDGMATRGCEVHSFDPSMKLNDHITTTGVIFHNLGLSSHDSDNFSPRKNMYVQDDQKWKMRRLKSVIEELGHVNRTIDVLKIDVEGHEWEVVKNIMDDGIFPNVKQFMLEWHLFPDSPKRSEFRQCQKTYRSFIDSGFPKFHTGIHPKTLTSKNFNIQADTSHVNTKFIKPAG